MKLKQLFAAALLLCSVGAWAQTDVTSTYIADADFESTTGWTQDHSSQYWSLGNGNIGTYAVANNKTSSTDDTHLATEYCLGIQCRWSTNYAAFTQTTSSLPVGAYTLTYDVQNKNASTKATYANRFTVTIGGNTYTDSSTEWMNGSSDWTTHTISFNVTEAATATISLGYGTGSNNFGTGSTPHLYVSHLKLTWTDPLAAAKSALQAEIDKASLCDAKEGLADAIAAAESVLASATTEAELEAALATLQAADKDAVLRYENGLADATYAAPVVTNFVVNGTFDSGISPWQRTGSYQNNKTANNKQGAFTGNFYENWNGSAQVNKMYQTINNIPNGTYRLDIAAFVNNLADPNESQYVFANNDKTYLTTVDPIAYEVWTVVTNNQVEVGLEQTTATANWMGIDNVSLRYYGAGDVINDAKNAAHKLAWEEAKAAAEAAIANGDYANVTGSEKTALQTEIAKAEPTSAAGYDEAAAALTSATQTFVNAKDAYDAYANFLSNYLPADELIYATAAKYTAIGDVYYGEGDVADAADATARVEAAISAVRAYYESHALAEGVDGAVNMTDRIANPNAKDGNNGWTWTGSKNNPASNEPWTDADGNSTHTYFDGGNWSGSSWTTTMKQTISLPAGKFLLTAKGRAATNTTLTMAVGATSVNLPNIGSAGNVFGRGWGDGSVEFITDGSDVEISVTATAEPTHEWFSISDFRLVRLELYTEMAKAADYEAMANALAAAKAKTLGFDAGEYTPYNNIEAIQAIAAAEAVDTDAENAKADIEAITTALGNWTANAAEVDAIFDGQFATTAANTTSGDINLPGWTKVDGIRLLVKDEAIDPGLAYTDGNAAVFLWGGTTLTYGEQTGYTLPLNKQELYEMTLKVAGWRDGDLPNYVSVELDGVSQNVSPTVGRVDASEGNPFASLKFYVVPTEDNSILKIFGNKHFTIADLSLKLATNVVLDENEVYTPMTAEKAVNVTMTRTVKAGYNTVCLPFDLTADQVTAAFGAGAQVYAFSENSTDPMDATINFNKVVAGTISANVPVLVKATAESTSQTFEGVQVVAPTADAKVEGTNFDFVGVYEPITVDAGDYFIGNGAIYKSAGTTNMNAFRAYIYNKDKTNGQSTVKMYIDGITTDINAIDNEQMSMDNEAIYTIAGQRLNNSQSTIHNSQLRKGIYIVNGKKVMVK